MLSFSIITPTLGKRRFLIETLESVHPSDCGPTVEHLVVTAPEASTTPRTVDLGSNRTECKFVKAPIAGAAAAFNVGLYQASGDIIGCLADDDQYLPRTLARVAEIFQANPDCDLIYGATEQIDEDSVAYRTSVPRKLDAGRLRRRADGYQPSLFFRRSVIDQVGGLDETLRYHYWYDFVVRAFLAEQTFFREESCLARKRRHRHNTHFGNAAVGYQISRAQERVELLHRHYGEVPPQAALELGKYLAIQQGHDPLQPGYDKALLHLASQSVEALGCKTRLLPSHVKAQVLRSLKYPRELTRYLPMGIGPTLRGFFRSRLFQLKQHEPRTFNIDNHARGASPEKQLSIGIVTPNLNTGEYLERTIESVVGQGFPRIQYVVQDGESTDNSVDIIRQYESKLHCWESRRDGGQTQAINRGLSHVDTDIMAYLNSDDILLPGSLSFVSEYFRSHPDVDVIYGHRLIIDENDQEIGRWVLPPHDDHAIMFADYIPQETMFWRKRAWQAVDCTLDESFQFAMDWDLILRFRSAGLKFVRAPRFLGAFRVIETQKTQVLLETAGTTEMNRLRRRVIGHVPTTREMRRAIRPYRFRQWFHHHAQTLLETARG
ncbi:glycosyltransferase [Roseiconus lacunae]|uniref:Glycosyltransferase n=1 Tax=Roseiconus lacunae TaxID=2605694 RepID=A0ABT7PG21_9BACT|nr:glycosyltransferase [Roseiconus lacunae]MDM4015444.1 glycosyltransferase [Roseiconus lacunae]